MKRIYILSILIFSLAYSSTGAAFLNSGVSARSEAMGSAFTAVANDLDAFYYNPGGFALQDSGKFNSFYTKVNNMQNVFYSGIGARAGKVFLAFNFQNTSLSDIPITDYSGGEVVDTGDSFNYSSSAMFFSAATNLGEYWHGMKKLSLGLNFKILSEKLYDNSAAGSGADLGLIYSFNKDLNIGFSIINLIEPKMTWDTDSGHQDTVERYYRAGISYWLDKDLLLACDLIVDPDENHNNLGIEYLVSERMSLRAGMMDADYSVGIGLFYNQFNFDYSFSQPYDELQEATHKIAVGYSWGESQVKETVKMIEATEKAEDEKELSVIRETITPVTPTVDQGFDFESIVEEDYAARGKASLTDFKLIKKTILGSEDKIKCFYQVENTGNRIMDLTLTIKVLDNIKGNQVGEKSVNYQLPAGAQTTYSEIVGLKTRAEEYKVKSFIQVNQNTPKSYIDYIY